MDESHFVDITIDPEKVDAFSQMERIRDASHVRVLTFSELKNMMLKIGLTILRTGHYKVSHQLDEYLQISFPKSQEHMGKVL
jgi:hypothetical protein